MKVIFFINEDFALFRIGLKQKIIVISQKYLRAIENGSKANVVLSD